MGENTKDRWKYPYPSKIEPRYHIVMGISPIGGNTGEDDDNDDKNKKD